MHITRATLENFGDWFPNYLASTIKKKRIDQLASTVE